MASNIGARLPPEIGTLIFLFLAPGIVAGVLPWWISGWRLGPALLGLEPLRWLALPMLILGGAVLLEAFIRFAHEGRGTPAPVYPTERLVVTGSYRYVRNPMYVAVLAMIAGQALLLGNAALLAYGLAVWMLCTCSSSATKSRRWRAPTGPRTRPIARAYGVGCPASRRGGAAEAGA